MDLKLKSEGRSMISRTGQHCYVKNRLLLKENEALSLRESGHHNSLNRVARIAKARRHRPSAAPDSPAKDDGPLFFRSTLTQSLSKAIPANCLALGVVEAKAKANSARYVHETITQKLRRNYRLGTGEYARKKPPMGLSPEKSVNQPGKQQEPYRYKLYNALKGFEFDAVAKNLSKKELTEGHKPARKFKPRVATWIRGPDNSAFDNAVYPIPSPRTPTYTFSKAVRQSVLITPGPNEKRFAFNPRAVYPDPQDLTHSRSTPAIDFSSTLPRDNKPFETMLTPSTIMLTADGVQSSPSAGVAFSKMMAREQAERRHRQQMRTVDFGDVSKVLDRLSTRQRLITPNFNLFKSRYRKGQKLPSFMENVNSRMAIAGLSFEMLKANNSLDSESLAAPYSSFCEKKSFRVESAKHGMGTPVSLFKTYSPTSRMEKSSFMSTFVEKRQMFT